MPCAVNQARWMRFDYEVLLPLLARMPLQVGRRLAWLRGLLYAGLDQDWRNHAVGFNWVRQRTRQAMDILRPDDTLTRRRLSTLQRYGWNSVEEWQGHLFARRQMEQIWQHSLIGQLEALKTCQRQGRGLVMVSCHLDSFCLGMVLWGMHGLRVNGVTTAILEDRRIHPKVRQFFKYKYQSMEQRIHGCIRYHETELERFQKALRAGEIVVLLGDIPGSRSTCWINWLGRPFRMPLGAWKLARGTNSLISAFVCLHEAGPRYRLTALPPREIDPVSPENTCQPLYAFLESWIRRYPERWIASDLLAGYEPPP